MRYKYSSTVAPTKEKMEYKKSFIVTSEDNESSKKKFGDKFTVSPALKPSKSLGIRTELTNNPIKEKLGKQIKTNLLIEKWGKWHFWDATPNIRPEDPYITTGGKDIISEKIPENAWQADAVYVNHFLDSAMELVERAKEAIYLEYGHGPRESLTEEELVERSKMFQPIYYDFEPESEQISWQKLPKIITDGAGWTTRRTFQSLVKRLLHAIITQSEFIVVMGGHSSAAGHGNHFLQSYMMQFHAVMKPIFDRLNVNLITRNIAQGGLGTLHHSIGFADMYGHSIDVLLWDSQMTERNNERQSMFMRQALMSGSRPPILVGGNFSLLRDLYIKADADVMFMGTGMNGVDKTLNEVQALKLPWAIQYLNCDDHIMDLCKDSKIKFNTTCWVERDDVTPGITQLPHVDGEALWHPGWRSHRLQGRVLSMIILDALQDALATWSDATIIAGHPLASEYWHIQEYYENIQTKAHKLSPIVGSCASLGDYLPERVCNIPMKARSEFTPRADPLQSAITTLLRPTKEGYIPHVTEELLYEGPDVLNPSMQEPDDAINVVSIVSNRRFLFEETEYKNLEFNISRSIVLTNDFQVEHIVPGSGWRVYDEPNGYCDGTATGICDRTTSNKCLLSGHMDRRGGILGNGESGWLVMDIPLVEEGIIIIKMETWHSSIEMDKLMSMEEETITRGVQEKVNISSRKNVTHDIIRQTKAPPPELPDDFVFQFSIDGEIISWNKDEFFRQRKEPERVVELYTLLDNPNKSIDKVELAIRMTNCGTQCVFKLTHVYWA